MTTLFFDEYVWKCKNCKKAIVLPGVAPSLKDLQGKGWNFCPFCGEMINYRYCEGRADSEIIRCKDCVHAKHYGELVGCERIDGLREPDWYCADGERENKFETTKKP